MAQLSPDPFPHLRAGSGYETKPCIVFTPFPPFLYSSMQCFTSIVGPNGSGKSNVIDSMLFVFGYRARKIRSKKISVLIHNSDKYRDVQSCTVAVHFQYIVDQVSGHILHL